MDDDPATAAEFAVLGGIDHDTRKETSGFHPNFASQPGSGWKTDPLPMAVQPKASPDERLDEIVTGPLNPLAVAAAPTRTRVKRRMKNWYIPPVFPYTHTHIDELGEWPQRLLHVPTMTSYEWTPGNVYNGVANPTYRAISYTWGRWKLQDKPTRQKPKVGRALEIRGVPWDIPRIDPAHFSSRQFEETIRNVCLPPVENAPGDELVWRDFAGIDKRFISHNAFALPAVEFLWLDIACIDQRFGPLAALEVGRQAGIFRNACGVAVWLSHTAKDAVSLDRLRRYMTNFVTLAHGDVVRSISGRVRPDRTQRAEILGCVREMLCDPWFTSLWTLQEAFLARNVFFVCGGGNSGKLLKLLPPREDYNRGLFTLEAFTDICRTTANDGASLVRSGQSGDDDEETSDMEKFAEELSVWVQKSGITAMTIDGNHLSLLTLARYRWASQDSDHIYGIMQVFGYRLGASRPGADPEEYFNREELEEQLGAELLRERTVQSQLFVFTEPVDNGKGWHLSRSSSVPQEYLVQMQYEERFRSVSPIFCHAACTLSTESVGGETYGRFGGSVCAFADINEAWDRLQNAVEALGSAAARRSSVYSSVYNCVRLFFPDVSPFVADSPEYDGWTAMKIPDVPQRQAAFGGYLQNKFSGNRLVVLHLGWSGQRHFGLILLHVGVGEVLYWHRLGTVVWYWDAEALKHEPTVEDLRSTLTGSGPVWHRLSGIFG